MSSHFLKITLAALILISPAAMGIPFNSFDPRSMGMGGTGVAVANTATAPLLIPLFFLSLVTVMISP